MNVVKSRSLGAGLVFSFLSLMPGGVAVQTSAQMTPPPDFIVTGPSSHDFDDTVAQLKQAIEAENLMVVAEVNAQQMLRMVGVRTGGMRQILFFHPRFMKQIVETNRNGGMEPPLKILVMERPDGAVMVRYHSPEHLFAPYGGLEGVAQELEGVVERIVAAVR
jgi:uncharacterized protein (DUF302 family)